MRMLDEATVLPIRTTRFGELDWIRRTPTSCSRSWSSARISRSPSERLAEVRKALTRVTAGIPRRGARSFDACAQAFRAECGLSDQI
jgi:hypothetical protein